jgi:hypothetical protein
MGSLWSFFTDEKNQKTLGWLGGGGVVVAGGLWAVVTYVWPHHEEKAATPTVQAGNCGIASTGTSSGNTVNCGAAPAAKP